MSHLKATNGPTLRLAPVCMRLRNERTTLACGPHWWAGPILSFLPVSMIISRCAMNHHLEKVARNELISDQQRGQDTPAGKSEVPREDGNAGHIHCFGKPFPPTKTFLCLKPADDPINHCCYLKNLPWRASHKLSLPRPQHRHYPARSLCC